MVKICGESVSASDPLLAFLFIVYVKRSNDAAANEAEREEIEMPDVLRCTFIT